jgi:hypothetical protein
VPEVVKSIDFFRNFAENQQPQGPPYNLSLIEISNLSLNLEKTRLQLWQMHNNSSYRLKDRRMGGRTADLTSMSQISP